MCRSYGDDEARAKEMQAYTLAQVQQGMPAVLEEGFEGYLAQKYGVGRITRQATNAVANRTACEG